MLRPKIGLDWDDVTAPFNSIAVAMANEKYHIDPPLRLEEIDTWENRGRAGVIKEFYEDEELYARQQVPEKNKKAVYRLMEIADVYFITAVAPAFMGIRAKQILTAFPEFPPERQMQRSWRRQGLLRSVFMDCSRWRLPGGECGSCFCAGIFCMKSF